MIDHVFIRCIRGRHLLRFQYGGQSRLVEPHLFGLDARGETVLIAYEVPGRRKGDRTGWHTYRTDHMENIRALDERFVALRAGRGDHLSALRQVICDSGEGE